MNNIYGAEELEHYKFDTILDGNPQINICFTDASDDETFIQPNMIE